MITSIQIRDNVKMALDRMRVMQKETYEEIIVRMMRQLEEQKKRQRDLLIEGCKEMADDSLKITKEFEATDAEIDWEWNES